MPRPLALSEIDEFDYILESNREDEADEQTRFRIKGLTGRERAQVRQALYGAADGAGAINLAEAYAASELAVAHGLKGWTNLQGKDKDGALVDIKFPGNGRKAIQFLPEGVVQELAAEIMAKSELSEEDRGN